MAHISEWRVRETTTTEGTADLVLAGAMRGSLPFREDAVMSIGDTCDYVVHYDTVFESGLGTMAADGKLQRTTVYRARHANDDINTTKVSLPPGVKTVIMSARANKIVRVDVAQLFSAGETAQHRANSPPFESGTRLIFQQTAAPVGWTKDVSTHNDTLLRFTTGTVGSSGSVNVSTAFGDSGITATNGFGITLNELPNFAPTGTVSFGAIPGIIINTRTIQEGTGAGRSVAVQAAIATSNAGDVFNSYGSNWTASFAGNGIGGGGQAHAHGISLQVKYADAIIAVAN